jgi:hypothetical protein
MLSKILALYMPVTHKGYGAVFVRCRGTTFKRTG